MAGRPSSYKEAYRNELIECLAKGHSIVGFAGYIGVAESTVHKWIKDYPDFAAAYEIAKAKSAFAWEGMLIEFAKTGKGSPAGVIFGVSNRARDEWRQVQKHELTGKDGGPIKTEEVSARDEISRRIAGIAARNGTSADISKLN